MTLSILIVNWNSKDYLRECLLSIRRTCRALSPQVVVVDGGSFDGCAEMVHCEFPEVEFVQSPENIGFGRSNNLGFAKVTGDALLLLNPDTELRPGAVEVLFDDLWQLPRAGMVGARLLNSDESLQLTSVHRLPTAWNVAIDSAWIRRRWWQNHAPGPPGRALEVEAISGACMMLRSETFLRVGGFDSRYFMYAEDMDLCFRIRRAGMKIYHAPLAQIVHHGGGSSRTEFSKFPAVMIREATHTYLQTHHGRFLAWASRFLQAVSACLRLLIVLGCWLPATGNRRSVKWSAMRKWWTVLRWCCGLEDWARARFEAVSKEVIQSPMVSQSKTA